MTWATTDILTVFYHEYLSCYQPKRSLILSNRWQKCIWIAYFTNKKNNFFYHSLGSVMAVDTNHYDIAHSSSIDIFFNYLVAPYYILHSLCSTTWEMPGQPWRVTSTWTVTFLWLVHTILSLCHVAWSPSSLPPFLSSVSIQSLMYINLSLVATTDCVLLKSLVSSQSLYSAQPSATHILH